MSGTVASFATPAVESKPPTYQAYESPNPRSVAGDSVQGEPVVPKDPAEQREVDSSKAELAKLQEQLKAERAEKAGLLQQAQERWDLERAKDIAAREEARVQQERQREETMKRSQELFDKQQASMQEMIAQQAELMAQNKELQEQMKEKILP